jgi:signal transduction histidine kinase
MFTRKTSIRGKITAGYLVGFLFLLLVASVLFVSFLVSEEEVERYAAASRLLDATLEMRRYEKNFLLYGNREDLREAARYADAAGALLADEAIRRGPSRHAGWLRLLGSGGTATDPLASDPAKTARLLEEYRALLRAAEVEPSGGGGEPPGVPRTEIRELGRGITDVAERLASVESRNVQAMLRAGRRAVVLLVALSLLGTAFLARVILLSAIRPLKELEAGMERIASGDYRSLPEGTATDEIGSMNRAFNHVIQEVFEHRQEVLRSERLASLGTALAGIAHELNNPLSNVSTSAEILLEENERAGAAERRELIRQIVSETERAGDIVRTVLDFTRERPFDRRSTNVLSAVRGSLILCRGALPARVSVDVDVPPDLEVLADKAKIEQAFINLVKNAVDAMRDGAGDGVIRISARPAGADDVEIVVRDTGAGIPAALLERVFDPFFTTKDPGKGTGLGLYLAHQIVELHGGAIRVESAAGEGTAVVITLPAPEPRPVDARAAAGEGRG